jgi:hypothetical protein
MVAEGMLIGGELAMFDKPEPLDRPYFEENYQSTPSRRERRCRYKSGNAPMTPTLPDLAERRRL